MTFKNMLPVLLGLLVAASAATTGTGQPPAAEGGSTDHLPALGEDSGLRDYLAYAALNNPGLKAAFNLWRAAVEEIPGVRALPDPRFTYSYFIEEVETRVGPQRQKVELSQVFPWFGKLGLRGEVATETANAARQEYEAAKLRLFYNVKKAYYEYYYLSRTVGITRENMELLANLENVARTKYRAGTAPYAAVIKMQVELGRLQDRLETLEELRLPLSAGLNAELGRRSGELLPWPTTIPDGIPEVSERQLLAWLRESNPELKMLDALAAKEDAATGLEKKSYFPDIRLGVGMIDTDKALMPDVVDSGKDPLIAMIGINLPLWYGKNRAAERAAEARLEAATNRRLDRENGLESDLKLALFNFRDARRKIGLYGDTLIPKARQSLEVARQGFEAGQVDFLNLIDAERLMLEFQLSHQRALVDRAQRLAELEMLVGRDIEGEVKSE